MSDKRGDIQILRTLAVTGVFCFHMWPKIFSFGYLGVDIFFVVSGYLMISIIAKQSKQNICQFYCRRIKRIFPSYLLIITVSLVIAFFTILPSDFSFLQIEALWSIFFVNNFSSMFSHEQYFELVSKYKFFLHTWSLGVEVQFYLIAPFLLNFILNRSKPLLYVAAILLPSLLLHLFVKNEAISFGLLFCRIWQFLSGNIAYFLITNSNEKSEVLQPLIDEDKNDIDFKSKRIETKSYSNHYLTAMIFMLLTVILFFPFNFPVNRIFLHLLRVLVTLLTSVFIAFNSPNLNIMPKMFENGLIYMGNASYSLYLIHWPVIIFFKYFTVFDLYDNIIALSCIFMMSLVIHEIFEKPISKLSWQINFAFVGICYAIILFLHFIKPQLTVQMYSTSEAIKLNEAEAQICKTFYFEECQKDSIIEKYLTKRPKESYLDLYCSYKINNSTSKTALITGNSLVYYQYPGIKEAIKNSNIQFSKVYVISHPGCSLLVGELNNNYDKFDCKNFNGTHDDFLNAVQPDMIIHTARTDPFFDYNKTSIDAATAIVLKTILNVANYTKKLIILQPTPMFLQHKSNYFGPSTAAHLLMMNQSISQFNTSVKDYHETIDPGWNIVKNAVKHCENCVTVDTEKHFCDKNVCHSIDPKSKIAIYCDVAHITPKSSMKLVPDLIKAIDKV